MKMMLDIDIKSPASKINYSHKIFLIGSCFTEHIGNRLNELKFPVIQNPNGILFDPVSVSNSLISYVEEKRYLKSDLLYLNELWQSWNHHTKFSGMDAAEVLIQINNSQQQAHDFLKDADWLIITLGSSFSYQLTEGGQSVANCHRAPSQWFDKHLLTIQETERGLTHAVELLHDFNPKLKFIFTISPVRHIRDGVVENNRSKSRLIEAVHNIIHKNKSCFYFPAYELVIDVLRDYRFYDIDLVHPNYAATDFVFDKFKSYFIEEETQVLMEEIKKIVTGFSHKPFQPETRSHQTFLKNYFEKVKQLQLKYPHLDFEKELCYFSKRNTGLMTKE
jgi:hypothetical protein